MSSQTGISVAIANWNGGDHVIKCLDSLYTQSLCPDDIVVVDNGSTDGSPLQIRIQFPAVRLLTRPRNEGFCAGYNRAIRATRSEYVLILNNDVTLKPDYLKIARGFLQQEPDIGWITGVVKTTGTPDLYGAYLGRHVGLVPAPNTSENLPVFAGSGASIFARRSMLDDISSDGEYYDESFFAYIEDLDLAWRAHHRGWRCFFLPSLVCDHVGSASQGQRVRVVEKETQFIAHILKNRFLALVKNATPGVFARFLPSLVLGEILVVGRLLMTSPAKLGAVPRSIADIVRLAGRTLAERRRIMRTRLVSDARILENTRSW